jgi:hypothetical protein
LLNLLHNNQGHAICYLRRIFMVRILEGLCQRGLDKMIVVVEGQSPGEVTDRNTQDLVIKYARQQGFPAWGLSEVPRSYPVDINGKSDEAVVLGKSPIGGYRGDYVLFAQPVGT